MAEAFIPSVCKTELISDGRYVRVLFERDEGKSFELLVPATQYPAIAKTLQTQADQLAPKKARKSLLADGRSLLVDSFSLSPKGAAELTLTVFARIADEDGERGLSIPIPLTPDAAQWLYKELDDRLSADEA